MSAPLERVFVYGTLLLEDIQRRVTGRAFPARAATLDGYARRTVRGETYPSVVPCATETVAGALLDGVDAASLARLDEYEGDAYERQRVTVCVAPAGEPLDAWLWLLRPEQRERVGEAPWDLDAFVARDLPRFAAEYRGLRPPGP